MARTAPESVAFPEHRWPAIVAIAVAVVVYALLPVGLEVIPRWIVPVIAGLLLVPVVVLNPHHLSRETAWSRWLSIGLAFVLAIANQVEVVLLVRELVSGSVRAPSVLVTAAQVWATNVIAYGLVYWELDAGGPVARRVADGPRSPADFRFPQADEPSLRSWKPAFLDYLYFSLSNMMAFSPTDVMPLTTRAKALMALEALTGFVLLALVISRAVNILA